MKSSIINHVPLVVSVIGIYSFFGLIGLLALRFSLIKILKRHGRFRLMGSPVSLNLSDFLPFRMAAKGAYLDKHERLIVNICVILYGSVLLGFIFTTVYILVYRA